MTALITSVLLQIDSLSTTGGKGDVSESVNMLSSLISIIVLVGLVLIVRSIYLTKKRKDEKEQAEK